jgi:vancomycin permeability regulator SanA
VNDKRLVAVIKYISSHLSPLASHFKKRWLLLILSIFIIIITFLLWAYFSVQNTYKNLIYYSVEEVPSKPVAFVLGAGVYGEYLYPVLEDRVIIAVELYKKGKVKKLLMSGDNSSVGYDEPTAMKKYAVKMGVPEGDIVLDYAGFRTYESFYRAKEIFSLTDIVIVTQKFHLPRSLYTSNKLGIRAVGIASDRRTYRSSRWYNIREFFSSVKAFIDVNITKPLPTFLGKKEKVF